MSDTSDPTLRPHLIGSRCGVANCDVRYSDGSIANIPYVRYLWEERFGRLKPGFAIQQYKGSLSEPELSDLEVIRIKTGASARRSSNAPLLAKPRGGGKGKATGQLDDQSVGKSIGGGALIDALRLLANKPVQPQTKIEVVFPGSFEDCRSGEEEVILWDFIRSASVVSGKFRGELHLLVSPESGQDLPTPKLIVSCKTAIGLAELKKLVNELKSQG